MTSIRMLTTHLLAQLHNFRVGIMNDFVHVTAQTGIFLRQTLCKIFLIDAVSMSTWPFVVDPSRTSPAPSDSYKMLILGLHIP